MRTTAPSLALGLVVAAALVGAESVLGYVLSRVAPEDTVGVVDLVGVVVIAIGWGFWLAAATSVASVLAFDFFLISPVGSLTVTDPRDWGGTRCPADGCAVGQQRGGPGSARR